MFHKRLLKEFNDNMKYVVGMVATQWVSLLANVGMMLTVAAFVANLVMVSFVTEGKTRFTVWGMIIPNIVLALEIPRDCAASYCPLSMLSIPPLYISEK